MKQHTTNYYLVVIKSKIKLEGIMMMNKIKAKKLSRKYARHAINCIKCYSMYY